MRFDERNRVLNGGDFFGLVVRDFAIKFFFEGHHEFNSVQAVSAQIINETGRLNNLVGIHAQMLNNNAFYTFRNVAHIILSLVCRGPGEPADLSA